MLLCCLVWCLSWLHLSNVFSPLEKPHFWMLDKSSIAAWYLFNLSRIFGFFSISLDRYLDPSSLFPEVSVCSIEAWHLLNLSRQFCRRYLLDTSLIYSTFFLNTILIPSQSIKVPVSIYTRGSTWFNSHSNISILLSSRSMYHPPNNLCRNQGC